MASDASAGPISTIGACHIVFADDEGECHLSLPVFVDSQGLIHVSLSPAHDVADEERGLSHICSASADAHRRESKRGALERSLSQGLGAAPGTASTSSGQRLPPSSLSWMGRALRRLESLDHQEKVALARALQAQRARRAEEEIHELARDIHRFFLTNFVIAERRMRLPWL